MDRVVSRAPAALVLLALAFVGCDLAPARAPSGAPPAKNAAATNLDAQREEFWNVLLMQGRKIGYSHTLVQHAIEGQRAVVETTTNVTMVVGRFGERTQQKVDMKSVETPEGQVIELRSEAAFGPQPMITTGRVLGNQLLLTTTAGGKSQSTQLPWSADTRGFEAEQQTLKSKPMAPGEQRNLRMLLPVLNQIADVQLLAKDYETVQLLDRQESLLRVESVARLPDKRKIESIYWVDKEGRMLKGRVAQQEQYLVDKAVALDAKGLGSFDVGSDVVVPVSLPVPNPHDLNQLHYRVTLEDGDPSEVFGNSLTQSVEPAGDHTAEITTTRFRVGVDAVPETGNQNVSDEPTEDDRRPNSQVESDDPLVVKLAREARRNETDPMKIATLLEKSVHDLIREKNFSQAFATAAETAKSREGDCTEHAVLLAAMLRASDIPARVAIGLVYVEQLKGFGYHMWTEAYLDGRWIPLDATLGRGGIGPAHLKLSHTNLAGASPYSSFLPVAQVLGRLKIEVLINERPAQ